ncbi:MAG: S8 family serine peptidase [Bacteroidota bacterium]
MNNQTPITDLLSGIDALWKVTKGDPTIKIAILDGPVDLNHPALKEASIQSVDTSKRKKIRSVHGTFVSSLIFANHHSGILGIAPECSGLVKSIYQEDDNGNLLSSSQSVIEQGIRVALEHGADIINISGGEQLSKGDHIITSLANALEECEKKGVLVVAATGNEGNDQIHVPASYPTVLAVGSIKKDGEASNFSNWTTTFSELGLVAPGENIMGAIPSETYQKATSNGTSFSTALVSGVAGLLASLQKQQGSKKDLLAIRQILLSSVTPCTVDEKIDCAPIMAGRLHIGNAMKEITNTTADSDKVIPNKIETDTVSPTISPKTANSIATTNPQNFLTLNNTNMENQTEVTPLSAPNEPQADAVTAQEVVTPPQQVIPSATTQAVVETVAPAQVVPSSCGCTSNVLPSEANSSFNPAINPGGYPTFRNTQLVNAIGQPSYDFGMRNNLDTFTALMKSWYEGLSYEVEENNKPVTKQRALAKELTDSPHDHKSMAAFLLFTEPVNVQPNIFMTSQLIWLLNLNATPVYAISPKLATFSDPIYIIMAHFLADNVGINYDVYMKYTQQFTPNYDPPLPKNLFVKDKDKDDVMRMVLPGYVSGRSKLINANYVEAVTPVAYGLKDWTLKALLDSMGIHDKPDNTKDTDKINEADNTDKAKDTKKTKFRKQLISILNRLYVTTLNMGKTPEDRALNYSLYNILELSDIVKKATDKKLQLSGYQVVPSKIERQNSIIREVQLTFFDPEDTNKAARTYSMQVDVSGVTPIMIGDIQEWYAPVKVATVG